MNTKLTPIEVIELVKAEYSLNKPKRLLALPPRCVFLRRGFNDHYLIKIKGERYIFRLYLNGKYYIDSTDSHKFELDLLDHLHHAGVSVAPAIRRSNNELLGLVDTPLGRRPYALFRYAPGTEPVGTELTSKVCYNMGKTMAEIHVHANSFTSAYSRQRLDIESLVLQPLRLIEEQNIESKRFISSEELTKANKFLASVQPIDKLTEKVNSIDVSGDEFGIIHCDLFEGNLHVKDEQVTVFDFDHCCFGWRAFDVSLSEELPSQRRGDFLNGYESVRKLCKGERDSLRAFAVLRRVWEIGDFIATKFVRTDADD